MCRGRARNEGWGALRTVIATLSTSFEGISARASNGRRAVAHQHHLEVIPVSAYGEGREKGGASTSGEDSDVRNLAEGRL